MKVKLEKNYKDHYTLSDLERARFIINYEKEDEYTVKDWAEYALREALKGKFDWLREVLKAEARTAKNCRAWNLYSDDSADMDVWIDATAETSYGFIKVGAYLSDIWQTGATEYQDKMYIRYFKEA